MAILLAGSAGTFRDVKNAPIHRWFPWIEGFADDLPRLAIEQEEPRSVYDPFLGSGTTALVALQSGIDVGGAEVNPFLRFVTRVKTVVAARLASEPRAHTERRFELLIEQVEAFPSNDALLSELFVDADYFERSALGDITRIKGAIEAHAVSALDRDFALMALARVLVDSSNMIRRADLRRRRPNETNGQGKKVLPRFRATLEMMVDDLGTIEGTAGRLGAIGNDARVLPGRGDPIYELSVTSPPYLNGTNYVRNTKLEMWVLDLISRRSELRDIRDEAVTAGINDVRLRAERPSFTDRKVLAVLRKLDEQAYDRRIPMMVASYLADMSMVFRSTALRLTPGAAMYLDIGDSRFSGVHVPTDELLTSVAKEAGLSLIDSYKIRDRRSKDGTPLIQKMLIFRTAQPRRVRPTTDGPRRRLERLVSRRPFAEVPYAARNWGHPWHSMCSYQAKLKPSIAHYLVREFSAPGDVVLDPFSGAGTIPLEACLQGRVGWGNDIGPLARQLTAAKTSRPDADEIRARMARFLRFSEERAEEIEVPRAVLEWGMNGGLGEYFHSRTLAEILAARGWLEDAPSDPATAFLWSAAAHILHGNRPYALSRRSHPITPFAPTGPTDHRALRPRLEAKVERLLAADLGENWVDGTSSSCDAVTLDVPEMKADVVITSPPFVGSTRFHTNNWMRTWFCGWEPSEFETERGQFLEQRQARDFSVYEGVFASLRASMRADGLAVWHLGRSRNFDMAREMIGLADPWFTVEGMFEEDVSACQSHGISDQGTTHTHQFVLMRSR